MTDLTIPNPELSNPGDSTEIDANFAAVQSTINGDLDTGNLSASAGILPAQLSASLQETLITLTVSGASLAAGWPAAAATTPLTAAPIPGSNGDTAWTYRDATWICNDVGAGAADFSLVFGEFDGAGLWVTDATLISAAVISSVVNNLGNDVKAQENQSTSLAYAATPKSLAIVSAGVDATALSAAQGFFALTVRLTRVLQSA